MTIPEIILAITSSIFLLTTSSLGIYIIIDEIKMDKEINKLNEWTTKFYNTKKRQMMVEIVFEEEEYLMLEGTTGNKYEIYLPGTNLKQGDLVTFKFAEGIIFYKIEK